MSHWPLWHQLPALPAVKTVNSSWGTEVINLGCRWQSPRELYKIRVPKLTPESSDLIVLCFCLSLLPSHICFRLVSTLLSSFLSPFLSVGHTVHQVKLVWIPLKPLPLLRPSFYDRTPFSRVDSPGCLLNVPPRRNSKDLWKLTHPGFYFLKALLANPMN